MLVNALKPGPAAPQTNWEHCTDLAEWHFFTAGGLDASLMDSPH